MIPTSDNRFDSGTVCHRCGSMMRPRPINASGEVVQWGKGVQVIWLCNRCAACAPMDDERGAPWSQVGLGL